MSTDPVVPEGSRFSVGSMGSGHSDNDDDVSDFAKNLYADLLYITEDSPFDLDPSVVVAIVEAISGYHMVDVYEAADARAKECE